jgi:hypothetical protein
MQPDKVKIKWFMLCVGCDEETATRYLKKAFWKLENAIKDKRFEELRNLSGK